MWNEILVQWVNSLKLSKPVAEITDLKDGEFFQELETILNYNGTANTRGFAFLLNTIDSYYPEFYLDCGDIELQCVDEVELQALVSLLLHYTCLHDGRECFTSPLCNSLPNETQIVIKLFLEKVSQTIVCKESLINIVNSIEPILKGKCLDIESPRASIDSPLQDVFKTPISSKFRRLQDQNKLLTKYKEEAELERSEKFEVQEELQNALKRNQVLEDELKLRISEICQLKDDIVEFEAKPRSECRCGKDSNMRRKYQTDIQLLEIHINKLEAENLTIVNENDRLKEKNKDLEIKYTNCQSKLCECEETLANLTVCYKNIEIELKQTQQNCAELSEIVDEYRKNNQSNESSVILDDDNMENLASTVVEVQLMEVRKQLETVQTEKIVLDATIEQLKEDRVGLQRKHETCLTELRQELADIESKNRLLQEGVRVLEQKSLMDTDHFNKQKELYLSQLREIEMENERNRMLCLSKTNELKEIKAQFDKALACEQDSRKRVEEHNSELSKTISEQLSKLAKIRQDLEQQCKLNNDLCYNLQQVQCERDDLLKKYELQQNEAKALSAKILVFDENVQNLRADLASERDEGRRQRDHCMELICTLETKEKQLLEAQRLNADLKKKCDKTAIELNDSVAELQFELAERAKLIDQSEKKCINLTDEVHNVTVKLRGLREHCDQINIRLDETRDQYDQSQAENIKLVKKLEKAEEEAQKWQAEKESFELTISGLRNVIEENLTTINDLKVDAEKNVNEVTTLKVQMTELHCRLVQLLRLNQIDCNPECDSDRILTVLSDHSTRLLQTINKMHLVYVGSKTDLKQSLDEALRAVLSVLSNSKRMLLRTANKENISAFTDCSNRPEDDLKRKNAQLKQKLLLVETAKCNLEKTLKQMREQQHSAQYNALMDEHLKIKDENDQQVQQLKVTVDKLTKELSAHKNGNVIPATPTIFEQNTSKELSNIRDAYSSVMGINAKLDLENNTLRKIIDERSVQLAEASCIKDAYEKLLEENNQLRTELDTINYKRNRDKEEYLRLLKKEQEEQLKHSRATQEIEVKCEARIRQMKDKMVEMYREELSKEMAKLKATQSSNDKLFQTVTELRSELAAAKEKISLLESRNKSLRNTNPFKEPDMCPTTDLLHALRRTKASTLPRDLGVNRSVGHGSSISTRLEVHMEDEDVDFNNKYLDDLKEGRCVVPDNHGRTDRMSQLQWRNSLYPPHLKSSYPAEMQCISPSTFKEEDIKGISQNHYDDSLSKLLPKDSDAGAAQCFHQTNNQQRAKKDFGTTSYKRPGPPTPSKNGGRLSLQGNEIHPIMSSTMTSDTGSCRSPKRATPSRIRALFQSRTSTSNSNSLVTTGDASHGTPSNKSERLHIFRKGK